MRNHILMVEDDTRFCEMVQTYFEQNGMDVYCCGSLPQARELFLQRQYDLILLDVMLGTTSEFFNDGFTFCDWLRRRDADVPVIFVTARGDESDIKRGYHFGCHDYVCKPYSVELLLLRVRTFIQLTAAQRKRGNLLQSSGITLDLDAMTCTADGVPLRLTPKQFRLLHVLMENEGRALSRELLLTEVWNYGYIEESRVVDNHISRLKKALGTHAACIESVPGYGYVFAKGKKAK